MCSMFEFKSSPPSSFSPSSLFSPRANVYHIHLSLMGRMFPRSTPRHLPQAQRSFLLPGLLTPSPSPSPSPSLLHPISFTLAPLAISLILAPSPLLPSFLPSPSLIIILISCIAILLGPLPQERVSIDLPPSSSRVAIPLILFMRRVFIFLTPLYCHSAVAAPPPRLTSMPAQLCRQIR